VIAARIIVYGALGGNVPGLSHAVRAFQPLIEGQLQKPKEWHDCALDSDRSCYDFWRSALCNMLCARKNGIIMV
jgi:hypothetical protein